MKRWLFLILMMFAVLPALSACGSDDHRDADAEKAKKEEEAKLAVAPKKALPICPQVAIVRALDDIRDYGAEKPSVDQLVSEARMENVEGNCSYKDTGIDISFSLNFLAARGPRMGGLHASFPFFIAVIDPDQSILNKDKMTVEFAFPSDKDKITTDQTEQLHIFIPLVKDKREAGPNYQVLVGFQLTQEQLDAKRAEGQKMPVVGAAKPEKRVKPVAEEPKAPDATVDQSAQEHVLKLPTGYADKPAESDAPKPVEAEAPTPPVAAVPAPAPAAEPAPISDTQKFSDEFAVKHFRLNRVDIPESSDAAPVDSSMTNDSPIKRDAIAGHAGSKPDDGPTPPTDSTAPSTNINPPATSP